MSRRTVDRAIVVAGFHSVDAYPMRRRRRVLGGLDVFRSQPGEQHEG